MEGMWHTCVNRARVVAVSSQDVVGGGVWKSARVFNFCSKYRVGALG